jgi:hypothetical protein
MTRLTKEIREAMATDLLKHKFEAAGKALAARSAELFDLVYEDKYDAETRRLMNAIMKHMRRSFDHNSVIDTNAGGLSLRIGGCNIGTERILFCPEIEPRPFLKHFNRDFYSYSDCPIGEKLTAFAMDVKAFAEEISTAKIEAIGALSSITTAKQLAEMWPEAMPIIGKRIPIPSGRNVPAVQFSELTKAFGLEA